MKRILFLIIALITLTVSVYAESDTLYYKATQVDFRFENEEYIGWQECFVPIEFIGSEHKINVYTVQPHYIDYGAITKKEYKAYIYMCAYGTDTNYEYIKVEWFLYYSGTYIIKLTSKGYEWKYKIVSYKYGDGDAWN